MDACTVTSDACGVTVDAHRVMKGADAVPVSADIRTVNARSATVIARTVAVGTRRIPVGACEVPGNADTAAVGAFRVPGNAYTGTGSSYTATVGTRNVPANARSVTLSACNVTASACDVSASEREATVGTGTVARSTGDVAVDRYTVARSAWHGAGEREGPAKTCLSRGADGPRSAHPSEDGAAPGSELYAGCRNWRITVVHGYERLPETTQTLYAELLEQVIHAEAEAVVGATLGAFVSKQIQGATYWYFQRQEGDRKRQYYLGRESDALLAWMEQVRQARERSAADEAQRTRHSAAAETVREAMERLEPALRERLLRAGDRPRRWRLRGWRAGRRCRRPSG